MKLRIFAIAAATTLGMNAYAATATGTINKAAASISDFYKKLEESPLSLSYINEIGANRDGKNDEKFVGVSMMHYATLGYKWGSNSLSFNARWDADYNKDEATDGQFTLANLNYKRSGLLTQDKHGVNASFVLRQRAYAPNKSFAESGAFYGYTRPGIALSRSLTDNLSLSGAFNIAVYNRPKASSISGQKTGSHYYYPYATLSYSINDKVGLGATAEYIYIERLANTTPDLKSWDLTLDASFQATKKISISPSVGMNLYRENQPAAKTWSNGIKKLDGESLSYAVSAYMSLF